MNWLDFGAGFLVGWSGRSLISKLLSLASVFGRQVKGVYKVILDATKRAFNSDVQRRDFNFKDMIQEDAKKYKNPVTLRTWLKKYMLEQKYRGLLIQGHVFAFAYEDPLTKDKLEYYDTTPLVLSFGIYFANTGNMIEYGINLHYLPRDVRVEFLTDIFNEFKRRYKGQMYSDKPRAINELTWQELKKYITKYGIDFAVRSYIPERRRHTIIVRYEDWGKIINMPSSKFVGTNDRQIERFYKQHLTQLRKQGWKPE
jgi:hypothetical protein